MTIEWTAAELEQNRLMNKARSGRIVPKGPKAIPCEGCGGRRNPLTLYRTDTMRHACRSCLNLPAPVAAPRPAMVRKARPAPVTVSAVDITLALVRDHATNRHADRIELACPVCIVAEPVPDALDLCNSCDVNASDPDSPAGYCTDCERSAREPEPEPTTERGAPGLTRSVYHVTAYRSHGDRDAGTLAYDATYGDRSVAMAWRDGAPYPVADVVADPWRELATDPEIIVAEYTPAPVRRSGAIVQPERVAVADDALYPVAPAPVPCPHLTRYTASGACVACGHVAEPVQPEPEPVVAPEPVQPATPVLAADTYACGTGDACRIAPYHAAELSVQPNALPIGVHASAEAAERCREMSTPVLAAVQPSSGRPTCPRCGQLFRMHGTGLAWHLANRPDCAPARLAIAV